MKLVIISPEGYEPREHAVLAQLFAAGLVRYHVRKPWLAVHELSNFVRVVPEQWRSRLVLHQHHDLAAEFGCGGVHFKDSEGRARPLGAPRFSDGPAGRPYLFTSRSCHDLAGLDVALGLYDSVFFSPVFPSISKQGYCPTIDLETVAERLSRRTMEEQKTEIIALGGITPENCARCMELGFDGVAVLGALWQAVEPLKVFEALQQSLSSHVA
jgi:thiamine-phosphate pyrophosphorylase